MLLSSVLTLGLIPIAMACTPTPPGDNSTTKYPFSIIGPEGSDPETTGYFVNHLSINVNNLTRSMEFYGQVFGMRHMFTFHLTRHLSFTYMGHSAGGRNGTGYQTTPELIRHKNNGAGLIEMVYLDLPGDDIPGPDKVTSTLSHLGIIVPDTLVTQSRLEKYGVTIYKKVNEPMPTEGPLSKASTFGDATHLDPEEFEAIRAVMSDLNKQNIFAADPDGNLLEILPQDEGSLFG